jgi:hypothetical protein
MAALGKMLPPHRSVPCTKASLEALQEIRIKYRWQAIDQEKVEKATLRKDLNLYY